MAGARPSDYFLNQFVAPNLTRLGSPSPPDLADIESAWVNRFILTSALITGVNEPFRTYLMHLFRRGEGAIEEYREACAALRTFVSSPSNVISPYFRSLRHFEACVSQAYQGYLIFRKLNGVNYFAVGDQSPLDRLLGLYNISKHADDRIESGQIPASGSLPIWLSDAGLESATVSLTYAELATVLTGLAGFCSEALDLITNARKYRAQTPPSAT